MAHIGEYMRDPATSMGLNNYIARQLSPKSSSDSMSSLTPILEKTSEKYIWRMNQPTERKYQLFPSQDKTPVSAGKGKVDPEQAYAIAMTQTTQGADRPTLAMVVRTKAKELTLPRRRKASIPELGPMTTVQELAMDSPTIPGRPPLHERSISAPAYRSWRRPTLGESSLSTIVGSAVDEKAENAASGDENPPTVTTAQETLLRRRSDSPKRPFLAKELAPLLIPTNSGLSAIPSLETKSSFDMLGSPNGTPPDVPPKSARFLEGRSSPAIRAGTPQLPFMATTFDFSPSSATSRTPPTTAITASSSSTSLPNSAAPVSATEARGFPMSTGPSNIQSSPMGHVRGTLSDSTAQTAANFGHRRERSDTSILDRGRPAKRPDGAASRRNPSKRTIEQEQKAFETLPQGRRASDAKTSYDQKEIELLRKQALGQACKFEVLHARDVDALSRELRALDERCDYLRTTHTSLRSGRRNLHERICSYLRSPRTAVFSHDSMLKQEEALAALDVSIDDWVSKLDHAENRRMRVRQKLLEHVAAAMLLPAAQTPVSETTKETSPTRQRILNMQRSMGEHTPPRSPTKAGSPNTSPARLAQPVEPVRPEPVQPLPTPPTLLSQKNTNRYSVQSVPRASAESIRIYVDTDVYGLLADVEDEMNRMASISEAANESKETLSATSFIPPINFRSGSPRAGRTASPKTVSPAGRKGVENV